MRRYTMREEVILATPHVILTGLHPTLKMPVTGYQQSATM